MKSTPELDAAIDRMPSADFLIEPHDANDPEQVRIASEIEDYMKQRIRLRDWLRAEVWKIANEYGVMNHDEARE